MKLPFLKKNRGLRPIKAKPRRPGNYWVQWSIAKDKKFDFWRIAFYDGSRWWIAGDDRPYHDYSFLKIGRLPLYPSPWLNPNRLWFWSSIICFIFSIAISVINLTKYLK